MPRLFLGSIPTTADLGVIAQVVAAAAGWSVAELKLRTRHESILWPRQVAMWCMRRCTPYSLAEIGQFWGGRDHATVINACQAVDQRLVERPYLRREIHDLLVAIEFRIPNRNLDYQI